MRRLRIWIRNSLDGHCQSWFTALIGGLWQEEVERCLKREEVGRIFPEQTSQIMLTDKTIFPFDDSSSSRRFMCCHGCHMITYETKARPMDSVYLRKIIMVVDSMNSWTFLYIYINTHTHLTESLILIPCWQGTGRPPNIRNNMQHLMLHLLHLDSITFPECM